MVLLLSLRLKAQTLFFFFNDTATTEIYTLSLHDALPIFARLRRHEPPVDEKLIPVVQFNVVARLDRKSTRLNSSHSQISYAVFCLKKKIFLVSSASFMLYEAAAPRPIMPTQAGTQYV